jgi:hypothetical protein
MSDYEEAVAALRRIAEPLEGALREIAVVEAFAETGTTGHLRDRVLADTKAACAAVVEARRHISHALYEARCAEPGAREYAEGNE